MSTKRFLVAELKNDEDLGEIVNLVSKKTGRLAVVDAVPGIFDSPPARPLPQREATLLTRKRIRVNAEDATLESYATQPMRHPPDDVAAQVDQPSDDLDSEANVDVMTVERIPAINSVLEKSLSEEGSSAGVLNVTNVDEPEDVKENVMRFFEHALEEEEFLDAVEAIPRKSGRKRRRRLGGGEYDVYSSRRKARTADETLFCGLCNSSMTVRASYGRTRLREHVLRHLNLPTAKCGLCDFTGILREHVRRHHSIKHKDEKLNCVDVEVTDEFNNKFEALWRTCFPETKKIPARSNYKRLIEGIMDTSGNSESFSKGHNVTSGSVNETMEALMQTLANGNRMQMPDGDLHEDDGDEDLMSNETIDIKPDMANLSAAVEDLVNESMTTHATQ